MTSDTPIYDRLVREWYAKRAKKAYAVTPDMIGCGQWELPSEDFKIPTHVQTRRTRVRDR